MIQKSTLKNIKYATQNIFFVKTQCLSIYMRKNNIYLSLRRDVKDSINLHFNI